MATFGSGVRTAIVFAVSGVCCSAGYAQTADGQTQTGQEAPLIDGQALEGPVLLADDLTLTTREAFNAAEILTRLERTERLLDRTQHELEALREGRLGSEDESLSKSDLKFLTLQEREEHYNRDDFPVFPEGSPEQAQQEQDESVVADLAEALVPIVTDCGNITWKPGVRIQTRYIYDDELNNHDFFVRRFRMKGSGDVFGMAKYGLELKIDSTFRLNTDPEPVGVVENAWLDFSLCDDLAFLRVGLYDTPFSRSALTSDSKLLFMDRSLVKGALTNLGFADNTIGFLLHGRPNEGRCEYMVGVFDDVRFEEFNSVGGGDGINPSIARNTDELMVAGRFVWNVLDPPGPAQGYADYRASYIGEGSRLAFAANFAFVGEATFNTTIVPRNTINVHAWGVDVFFNSGPWVAQAEYDAFREDSIVGLKDESGDGWYAQCGYLLNHRQYACCECAWGYEIAARYEQSDVLNANVGNITDRFDEVLIGFNIYMREHNLKIQSDYDFRNERDNPVDNNVFQTQLQFDY